MSSCILYQNPSATITILDIPQSIELAQRPLSSPKSPRLVSSKPLEHPYPSVEPKSAKSKANVGSTSLEDLLLQKHLEFAVDEVKGQYEGPWCLPRVTVGDERGGLMDGRKRRRTDTQEEERGPAATLKEARIEVDHVQLPASLGLAIHYHNPSEASIHVTLGVEKLESRIPSRSTLLQGAIHATLGIFKNSAPKFELVVLDPPWPNRSARRKQSYSISYGNPEIKSLLSSIPIYDHLADEGIVAVWVTNKLSFKEMILGEGGLFEEWGVELVEEWMWLKITSEGQPICALDSTWRKPYEVLLVGRRGGEIEEGLLKRKVIIGVPDFHSRKPNLKVLFENIMGKDEGEYEALEIFARNLTSRWWSWGNEALKFQTEEHWAEP